MKIRENWSWLKFFGGLFNGLNTAKSIVLTFHQIIIALTVGSLIFGGVSAWKHFHKKKGPKPILPIEVTTNNGFVHSSSDDNRKKNCFVSFCF